MIRFISLILTVCIVFIVSCLPVAADEIPDGAMQFTSRNYFMWYLSSGSGYNATDLAQYTRVKADDLTLDGLETTNYTWIYPFADMYLTDGTRAKVMNNHTYRIECSFQIGNMTGWDTLLNFPARLALGSSQALSQTIPVTTYTNDNTYSVTMTESVGLVQLVIVFHITKDLPADYYYVAPFIYFTGASQFVLSNYRITGYIDPDLGVYENLILGQLDDIKGAINDASDQAHQDSLAEQSWLQQIEAALNGGTEDHPDTDSSDELAGIEGDIMDNVSSVTLPNGTTISASSNVFEQLDDWIKTEYSPVEFDEDASSVFTELFDVFMPYVGIVIFLNLTLALGISFLSGRRAGT